MKTYTLHKIRDIKKAEKLLTKLLPKKKMPWVLFDIKNDPVAYFNIVNDDSNGEGVIGPAISADISGRHYSDGLPIGILDRIACECGGEILTDG